MGGGATRDTVAAGFRILLKDPNVKGIFINIFGGIVRCERIANGVIEAAKEVKINVPLVVRLQGTNAPEGRTLLAESGLKVDVADDLWEAAQKIEVDWKSRLRLMRPGLGLTLRSLRESAAAWVDPRSTALQRRTSLIARLPGAPGRREREEDIVSILVNKNTRVVVQGITGKEGSFHATQCKAYGTQVVAGVTPGKAGQEVEGIPVFNTVRDAVKKTECDTSLIFVPPPFCADAILEAADAGVKLVICITEGILSTTWSGSKRALRGRDVRLVGPNCPGVITVDEAKIGIMPGFIHKKGVVGVVSRSGTSSRTKPSISYRPWGLGRRPVSVSVATRSMEPGLWMCCRCLRKIQKRRPSS